MRSDLAITRSKFLRLGMPLDLAIRSATAVAAVVDRPDFGTLSVGSPADAVIFGIADETIECFDMRGERLVGDQRLAPQVIVVGGEVWHVA